jgi:SAM-dependent methyltransferase
MKQLLKFISDLGLVAGGAVRKGLRLPKRFPGSAEYWKQRYAAGGNSGAGSQNALAKFKAEVLNHFVRENHIKTVIEYGCGDGFQLRLADYPSYIGFDISPHAIALCKNLFSGDQQKAFRLMHQYTGETAELTLSLDVIYHLVEDDVFDDYMDRLFGSSTRFVIIYSSNSDHYPGRSAAHMRHRMFSNWIEAKQPQWRLVQCIPNKYPYTGDQATGSVADFYIYERGSG